MRAALLALLLTAPALAQGGSQEQALTGLATAALALLLVWRRRCKLLPQYMPGDVRPTLKEAPPVKPAEKPAPVAPPVEPAPASAPLEFAPPVAAEAHPVEELVFEKAAAPEPEPEPELDPASLESAFLELQGQFEEQAAQLASRLQTEWAAMRAFVQQPRSAEPGLPALEIPEVEVLGRQPPTTADPVAPPDEIDGRGWSEPAENGVRSRGEEFLGPLTDPGQPPGPTNARPYYRERRVEVEGLVFREITRGIVVGKQLHIQESARFPQQGIPTLLELHRHRAREAGLPVAYRLWMTADHSVRVFATRAQVQALEPLLLELPAAVRARVPDLLVAPDLGGRVDWEGAYFQYDNGRPATHAVLSDASMVALRHGLQPDEARAALAQGLAGHLGEEHLPILLEQWDEVAFEPALQLKMRLLS